MYFKTHIFLAWSWGLDSTRIWLWVPLQSGGSGRHRAKRGRRFRGLEPASACHSSHPSYPFCLCRIWFWFCRSPIGFL